MRLAILPVLLSALLSIASAQDDKGKNPQAADVGVFVEHIQLDEPTATKLIRAYTGDGTALRKHLQALVAAQKAEILASSYLLTRSGKPAKLESVSEFFYPTAFNEAQIPRRVTEPAADGVDLFLPAAPDAFDVRSLGFFSQIEVTAQPGSNLIALNLVPELVELVGELTYGKGLTEAHQPVFYVMKTYTNVTAKSGEHVLLGMQIPLHPDSKAEQPKNDPSKRVFVMARATILGRKKK